MQKEESLVEAHQEFYDKVLEIESDNAWARDERRRYQRYLTYED